MTVSAKFLINVVDISNLGLTIGHPNGTQALITKIDDLKINNDITVYDVLVVPEYTVSLLSVYKIARDSKLFVGFDETKCYIQDLKANIIVRIGNQCNGLYLFNVDNAYLLVDTVRRSSRQTNLPTSLIDFIIDGKVKYDVERIVNYANLSPKNLCFASGLNKSIEPNFYKDVILDNNWINAMNAEIKAINNNHT
nr:ribonuclease H-like domain-containing protein [Tanacetum cinerariifolium]